MVFQPRGRAFFDSFFDESEVSEMAGTGEIRAGAAFVELYLRDNKFTRGLSIAAGALKHLGDKFSAMGKGMMLAGGAVLGPAIAATKVFASMGDALGEMGTRTGTSVEFLSALGHAAKLNGSDLAGMEISIRKLQRSAYDASTGSKSAADAFKTLGVAVSGVDGRLKPTEQLFMESAIALSRMQNETEKAALATILFGRSGTGILPMLKDGAKGFAAAMEEAKRLGIVLSAEDVAAADRLADAMTRVSAVMKRVIFDVGAAIAGPLGNMEDVVLKTGKRMSEWVQANHATIVSVVKLAASVVAAGAAIFAVGQIIANLGTILRTVGTAAAFVATPMGALVAALAATVLIFRQVSAGSADLRSEMQGLRAAGDQLRAADQQRFARLRQLAGQQDLSNAQMDEAAKTIQTLQSRYGTLNMRLDRMAGSLTIGTDALEGFNAAMGKAAVADVNAEIGELEYNLRELQRVHLSKWGPRGSWPAS
jgi:hypothetical protein